MIVLSQLVENGDLDLTLQLQHMGQSRCHTGRTRGSDTNRSSVSNKRSSRPNIDRLHEDLIGEQFWSEHPDILNPK